MAALTFDPTHAVRFDLSGGSVLAGGGDGDPVLLVPTEAFEDLVRSAPAAAVEAIGKALGGAIGRRVAARSDASVPIESFVSLLAGEAAVAGIGALSVERWGRALVVVIERSPLAGTLLVPLVAAAIEAASGRSVACALLSRDERAARVLVASERSAARVREWLMSGIPWGEALVKLHGAGA